MRTRTIVAACVACTVLAAGCGATGDSQEEADERGTPTTATASDASTGDFGDLEQLCGPGDYTVEPDEQGLDNGMLNVGVASDRGAELRPGLNRELWDSSVAFSEWCNEAGGVGGLQINLVDLDGALFNVEAAMSTACTDVFAMVGGGHAQDNLQFSGIDGSDFHRCGLIDVPAFTVSSDKSASNGVVQVMPNSPVVNSYSWIADYAGQFPDDAAGGVAIVYGDVPSVVETKDMLEVLVEAAGLEVVETISYPPLGTSDWTPIARQVIESGATTFMFVGEANFGANILAKLKEQGFEGRALLEANMYDDQLFGVGTEGPEGSIVRMAMYPIEEADDWPAVRQYLDMLDEYTDDGASSPLGMASMSSWAAFVDAANSCAEQDDGVLTRTCILEQADEHEAWTGGGLHGPSASLSQSEIGVIDDERPFCTLLLQVRDGKFVRLYPEIGSEDDDLDGFHCSTGTMVEVPGREDVGVVDPDRPI
jgi:hypothetical protein